MGFTKAEQIKVFKKKVWKTTYADAKFSSYIRERDPWCKRCKRKESTDCSHFWRRGHSGTRFDPKNCVGVCRDCHTIWEHQKNNDYKDFMILWLGGIDEYALLEIRARTFKNRTDAVLEFMAWYENINSYADL